MTSRATQKFFWRERSRWWTGVKKTVRVNLWGTDAEDFNIGDTHPVSAIKKTLIRHQNFQNCDLLHFTLLGFRSKFAEHLSFATKQFNGEKHHCETPVFLSICSEYHWPSGTRKGKNLCSYEYQEAERFAVASDREDTFTDYFGVAQRMVSLRSIANPVVDLIFRKRDRMWNNAQW